MKVRIDMGARVTAMVGPIGSPGTIGSVTDVPSCKLYVTLGADASGWLLQEQRQAHEQNGSNGE